MCKLYLNIYKHRFFCTLSYPEGASKINAKHVEFFNQIFNIQRNFKRFSGLNSFYVVGFLASDCANQTAVRVMYAKKFLTMDAIAGGAVFLAASN